MPPLLQGLSGATYLPVIVVEDLPCACGDSLLYVEYKQTVETGVSRVEDLMIGKVLQAAGPHLLPYLVRQRTTRALGESGKPSTAPAT